jgi:hypothetical protein
MVHTALQLLQTLTLLLLLRRRADSDNLSIHINAATTVTQCSTLECIRLSALRACMLVVLRVQRITSNSA